MHRRETSNALNAWVRCKQKRLLRLSETVPANNRIPQAVRQRIPDRRTSHTESPSVIKAELVTRYNQELSGGRSEMLPWCDWLAQFQRYGGAWLSRQLNTMTPSLYTTCSGTSSQSSSVWRSRDKPRWYTVTQRVYAKCPSCHNPPK